MIASSLLPTIKAQRRQGSVTGHPEIDGQYAAAWVTFSSQRKMDELMNTF